jgi:hypothetical protein
VTRRGNQRSANQNSAIAPALLAALAHPDRLELFCQIVSSADGTPPAGRWAPAKLQKELTRLVDAGLLEESGGRYSVRAGVFDDALAEVNALRTSRRGPAGIDQPNINIHFQDGRLAVIPQNPNQRGEVLEWIAFTLFDSRVYTEPEMNVVLVSIHDDFATLRRYLVDEGYFDRDASGAQYRRAEDSALRRWMITSANAPASKP